jgi:hypothetical protein
MEATMREIKTRITFTQPCLGATQTSEGVVMFEHVPGGVVMPAAAWERAFASVAETTKISKKYISHIVVDPKLPCSVVIQPRFYGRGKSQMHETIPAGSSVVIHALVPDQISDQQYIALLTLVGKFCGMSPYGFGKRGYGRFSVAEAM